MNRFAVPIVAAVMGFALPSGACLAATVPPSGGTISIELKAADGDPAALNSSFVDAAGEAFARRGFTILQDSGHAAYVAELVLSRVDVGTGSARAKAGAADASPGGINGAVGAGVVIPLPTGKTTLVPLQRTQLEMRISKRGEDGVVWHGAAMTVRTTTTRKGSDTTVASDLSEAILRSYPAMSEGVIGVP